jgi:hypothetical protein
MGTESPWPTIKDYSLDELAQTLGGNNFDSIWGRAVRAELRRREVLLSERIGEAQIALQRIAADAAVETGTHTRRMATWMLASVVCQLFATLVTIAISLL